MSEGAAYRRIRVARLARQFGVVFELVASGRIHLAGLAVLAPHLTEDNHRGMLDAACGKSKRQVEELVARHFPRPDVPDRVRKLPTTKAGVSPSSNAPSGLAPSQAARPSSPSVVDETPPSEPSPTPAAAPSQPRRDMVAPLSEEQFRVQFTASRSQVDKVRRLQALLSHQVPDGDLAQVVELAVDALTERVLKQRYASTSKPRVGGDPSVVRSRRVPAAVRREVAKRDGGQCTFVDAGGRRCQERRFLELDHVQPLGRGGDHSASNVRLLCRGHNAHAARQVYGKAHVRKRIAETQRRAKPGPMHTAAPPGSS